MPIDLEVERGRLSTHQRYADSPFEEEAPEGMSENAHCDP